MGSHFQSHVSKSSERETAGFFSPSELVLWNFYNLCVERDTFEIIPCVLQDMHHRLWCSHEENEERTTDHRKMFHSFRLFRHFYGVYWDSVDLVLMQFAIYLWIWLTVIQWICFTHFEFQSVCVQLEKSLLFSGVYTSMFITPYKIGLSFSKVTPTEIITRYSECELQFFFLQNECAIAYMHWMQLLVYRMWGGDILITFHSINESMDTNSILICIIINEIDEHPY